MSMFVYIALVHNSSVIIPALCRLVQKWYKEEHVLYISPVNQTKGLPLCLQSVYLAVNCIQMGRVCSTRRSPSAMFLEIVLTIYYIQFMLYMPQQNVWVVLLSKPPHWELSTSITITPPSSSPQLVCVLQCGVERGITGLFVRKWLKLLCPWPPLLHLAAVQGRFVLITDTIFQINDRLLSMSN